MLKSQHIGVVNDTADIAVFSIESVKRLAERLGVTYTNLIEQYSGIPLGFKGGNYAVDRVTAIDGDGNIYPVIVIGSRMEELERFLQADEPSFREFYNKHPRNNGVYVQEVFDLIADEYRQLLGKGDCTLEVA